MSIGRPSATAPLEAGPLGTSFGIGNVFDRCDSAPRATASTPRCHYQRRGIEVVGSSTVLEGTRASKATAERYGR